ncbi:MAG: MlaD family protein [Bacteroidota bacterium]
MKKDAGKKIRLGIFVTLGLVMFLGVVYYIGQRERLFGGTILISGVFTNVNGLQEGHSIRYTGINIGTVKEVQLITDTSANVVMKIDKNAKKFIKKDATAVIGSEGLMGNKVINIIPGTSGAAEIKDKDVIGTITAADMDQVMVKVNRIADDISAIVGNVRSGNGTIGKLFMDTAFASNVDQTISGAKKAVKGVDQTMKAAQNNFLLKPYFKKKEREKEKKAEDAQEKQKTESDK